MLSSQKQLPEFFESPVASNISSTRALLYIATVVMFFGNALIVFSLVRYGLIPAGISLKILYLAAGVIFSTIGVYARRKALKKPPRDMRDVLSSSIKPPIFLLRSFEQDDAYPGRSFFAPDPLPETIESNIVMAFERLGPVVGLSPKDQLLPRTTAARACVANEDWQDAFWYIVDRCQLIIVIAGLSSGLQWELETLFSAVPPTSILIIFPPAKCFRKRHQFDDLWRDFRNFSGPWAQYLPEKPQPKRETLLVTFDSERLPKPINLRGYNSKKIFKAWQVSKFSTNEWKGEIVASQNEYLKIKVELTHGSHIIELNVGNAENVELETIIVDGKTVLSVSKEKYSSSLDFNNQYSSSLDFTVIDGAEQLPANTRHTVGLFSRKVKTFSLIIGNKELIDEKF